MALVLGTESFCGDLKRHDAHCQLVAYETCDGIVRQQLFSSITGECRLLPPLPGHEQYSLHFDDNGYAFLQGPVGTTSWAQPMLKYGAFENGSSETWVMHTKSKQAMWPSEVQEMHHACMLKLVFGVPAGPRSLCLWHFPLAGCGVHLWWSMPSIVQALSFATGKRVSRFVNKSLGPLGRLVGSHGLPDGPHIRRSKPYSDVQENYGSRRLDAHSVSTSALLAILVTWCGAPKHQGRLGESRVGSARAMLDGLCARGLRGRWSFFVVTEERVTCTPHFQTTGRRKVRIEVHDGNIDLRLFLETCRAKVALSRPGGRHVQCVGAAAALLESDLEDHMSVSEAIVTMAGASVGLVLFKQFLWHLGRRIDMQIESEVSRPSAMLLSPNDSVPADCLAHREEHGSTDYRVEQRLVRYRHACCQSLSRPLISSFGIDASDVGKRSTFNATWTDVADTMAVVAPTVFFKERYACARGGGPELEIATVSI